jgi:hypothetical protein
MQTPQISILMTKKGDIIIDRDDKMVFGPGLIPTIGVPALLGYD